MPVHRIIKLKIFTESRESLKLLFILININNEYYHHVYVFRIHKKHLNDQNCIFYSQNDHDLKSF